MKDRSYEIQSCILVWGRDMQLGVPVRKMAFSDNAQQGEKKHTTAYTSSDSLHTEHSNGTPEATRAVFFARMAEVNCSEMRVRVRVRIETGWLLHSPSVTLSGPLRPDPVFPDLPSTPSNSMLQVKPIGKGNA